jgi:RNA polymerase sigma-70 factor (ECF subfamily)
VARNAVVDHFRMARPTEPLPEDLADAAPLPEDAVAPVDALADCMTRVLRELAPDDRAILQACDLDGHTQRDFALTHGLSLPAAKARLLRARQRLRDRLTTVCRVQFSAEGTVDGHLGRRPQSCDDGRCK